MQDLPQEARAMLDQAQLAEQRGDWFKVVQKRNNAINAVLARATPTPEPRPDDPTNDLEKLGDIHTPSKRAHNYLRHYWRYFRDVRYSARKVVEVGVQTPRSINMWEEFFPNATIYGLDIDPRCAEFAGGRKKVFIGDQTSEAFMMDFIAASGGDFDVVIDDGLHTTHSMFRTFSFLYPALHSRGIYVIEDIQEKPYVLAFLHSLLEAVNFMPPGAMNDWPKLTSFPQGTPWLVRNTVGVAFHRYIAFIERGHNPRDNPFLVEPEAYDARLAAYRAQVVAAAEELQRAGTPVNNETLLAKLGFGLRNHITRYLENRS